MKQGSDSSPNGTTLLQWVKAATAFLGVLSVSVIGGCYATNQKEAELSHQYVAMAVGILQRPVDSEPGQPLSPHEQELRKWAVALLDDKSPAKAKLTAEAKAALIAGDANIKVGYNYTQPRVTQWDSGYVQPKIDSGYVGVPSSSQGAPSAAASK